MRILSIAIAMIFGLLVLLGYFFPIDSFLTMQMFILEWAIILAAVAMFVGGINLINVHVEKTRAKQKNALYSFLLVFTLVTTLLIGLIPPGPTGALPSFLLDAIIVPAEATLLALLAVTLVYATVRLFRRRVDLMVFLFLGMALFTLLAAMPFPFGNLPFLNTVQDLLLQPFVLGGLRGVLFGVALGALTTGLRVLFGTDRPYGGK
jgi:hypothetical protein